MFDQDLVPILATSLTSEWTKNEVPFADSSENPPSALLSMEIMGNKLNNCVESYLRFLLLLSVKGLGFSLHFTVLKDDVQYV